MLQAFVSTASRVLNDLNRSWFGSRQPAVELSPPPQKRQAYRRLQRVILSDEVSRTIFQEYSTHRRSERGDEETGWVLLGIREETEAIVLATLPAGAERSAGVAHVHFNASAQALASRIVRQSERSLTMLGVVHTHPGSLRHPSDGDFRGDSLWVGQLRGKEGIFGIGTADVEDSSDKGALFARQPRSHVQCLGPLRLSWYALGEGDSSYRSIPVQLTLGPDLALPLHPVWQAIENFAEPLDRLCRQQAQVSFEVVQGKSGKALAASLKLADRDSKLRLLLEKDRIHYHLFRDGDIIEVDPNAEPVDRAVYLILAELAGRNEA